MNPITCDDNNITIDNVLIIIISCLINIMLKMKSLQKIMIFNDNSMIIIRFNDYKMMIQSDSLIIVLLIIILNLNTRPMFYKLQRLENMTLASSVCLAELIQFNILSCIFVILYIWLFTPYCKQ